MSSATLCPAVGSHNACRLVCSLRGSACALKLFMRALLARTTDPCAIHRSSLSQAARQRRALFPDPERRQQGVRALRCAHCCRCSGGSFIARRGRLCAAHSWCTARSSKHQPPSTAPCYRLPLCRRAASRGVPGGSAARAEGGRGGQRQHRSRRRERSQRRLLHARGLHLSGP